MAILSFRSSEDNGLSIELLVDGEPLGSLIGAHDTAIPYWLIEDDLPYYPPGNRTKNRNTRIVCVCSCGEYGCGNVICHIVEEGNEIVFRDFDHDTSPEGSRKQFRFAASNYRAVVEEIVTKTRQFGDASHPHSP